MDTLSANDILELLLFITRPPPDLADYQRQGLIAIQQCIFPPPDPVLDMRIGLHGNKEPHFIGQDLFAIFSRQRYNFF